MERYIRCVFGNLQGTKGFIDQFRDTQAAGPPDIAASVPQMVQTNELLACHVTLLYFLLSDYDDFDDDIIESVVRIIFIFLSFLY